MDISNVLYYSLYENSIYICVISQDVGKYYICKTNTANFEIRDIYKTEKAKEWILNYKPRKIVERIHSLDPWDEDKITLKYMDKYGIENVRGGSFSSAKLAPEEIATIRTMISGAHGKCTICGNTDHYKTTCPITTEFQDYEVVIKDKNDVLLTTSGLQTPASNESERFDVSQYLTGAITSLAISTSNIWSSLFNIPRREQTCLRCGFVGHLTGNCSNDIKKWDDSLIFPDNKTYNPLYKPSYKPSYKHSTKK